MNIPSGVFIYLFGLFIESISLSTPEVELQKFTIFEILQCTGMEKFILGLNIAKNTDYNEKCFKQKLRRIKFPKKIQWTHISIYPRSKARGFKDLAI